MQLLITGGMASLSALSLLLLLLKATKASATQSFAMIEQKRSAHAWVVSMCGDQCHQKTCSGRHMLKAYMAHGEGDPQGERDAYGECDALSAMRMVSTMRCLIVYMHAGSRGILSAMRMQGSFYVHWQQRNVEHDALRLCFPHVCAQA